MMVLFRFPPNTSMLSRVQPELGENGFITGVKELTVIASEEEPPTLLACATNRTKRRSHAEAARGKEQAWRPLSVEVLTSEGT